MRQQACCRATHQSPSLGCACARSRSLRARQQHRARLRSAADQRACPLLQAQVGRRLPSMMSATQSTSFRCRWHPCRTSYRTATCAYRPGKERAEVRRAGQRGREGRATILKHHLVHGVPVSEPRQSLAPLSTPIPLNARIVASLADSNKPPRRSCVALAACAA